MTDTADIVAQANANSGSMAIFSRVIDRQDLLHAESLLTALLILDPDDRQAILDAVAERTGQRAGRATLIERHAVTPAKAFANM